MVFSYFPVAAQAHSAAYHAAQAQRHRRRTSPPIRDYAPRTYFEQFGVDGALSSVGLPQRSIRFLANALNTTGDIPLHAGQLWNGKIYVVTQRNQLYYGPPHNLQKLEAHVTRTRSLHEEGEEFREFRANNGSLAVRITTREGSQSATVKTPWFFGTCRLPMPHYSESWRFPKIQATTRQSTSVLVNVPGQNPDPLQVQDTDPQEDPYQQNNPTPLAVSPQRLPLEEDYPTTPTSSRQRPST